MQIKKKEMWFCSKCGYKEPVSSYKQSTTRHCPECFKNNKVQLPMRKI